MEGKVAVKVFDTDTACVVVCKISTKSSFNSLISFSISRISLSVSSTKIETSLFAFSTFVSVSALILDFSATLQRTFIF